MSVRSAPDTAPKGVWRRGRWTGGGAGVIEVRDPANDEVVGVVGDASHDDVARAVDAIVAAAPGWARTSRGDRSALLGDVARRLTERAESYAQLLVSEVGKPHAEALAEVTYAADYFRWYSAQALELRGICGRSPFGDGTITVDRRPVGPCLLIVPWNFPLAMAARKVAPALAAGCTFMLKPAELAPLAVVALFEDLLEAGMPPDAGAVVTTSDPSGLVDVALTNGGVRKISFTGSTAVGRSLAVKAGQRLLRVSLELGGNAPFIVFSDADIDAAVSGAVAAKLRNAGQACTAANRFLVHSSVFEEFTARLACEFDEQLVGPGSDRTSTVGPVIDDRARRRVASLVEDAVAAGASLATRRTDVPGSGAFVRPALVLGATATSPLVAFEVFGPVAAAMPFDTADEAISAANSTEAGLVGYVYARDPAVLARCSEELDVGMVGCNRAVVSDAAAPFGGVKSSGQGREGGAAGLTEYEVLRYLAT